MDMVVITAPSPAHADQFRALIERRRVHGLYPREFEFRVCCDPPAGRIGSGGSTLLTLADLVRDSGETDPSAFFARHRILIIHAGGESRRMPCYAPEGKLFAPVPVASSSVIPPVVLDLQLALFLKFPWRRGEVVISSGDVVIDFDATMVPDDRGGVCGFAKPASLAEGSHHGVFKFDARNRSVIDFYQKATPEFLAANARIEGTNDCALDMGIVTLDPQAASALVGLGAHKAEAGIVLDLLRNGTLAFDLYLELLSACLPALTFDAYATRLTKASRVPTDIQRALYDAFHPRGLGAVLTHATSFIHMGSLRDYPDACLELAAKGVKPFYAQESEEIAPDHTPHSIVCNAFNSSFPSHRYKTTLAESVADTAIEHAGGNNVFIGLDHWSPSVPIPEGICIDCREHAGGQVMMAYGIEDTFTVQPAVEKVVFCGTPMHTWLSQRGLSVGDVWADPACADLLSARLFAPGMADSFLEGYWQQPADNAWAATFRAAPRLSVRDLNTAHSVVGREQRRIDIRTRILRRSLLQNAGWKTMSSADFSSAFKEQCYHAHLKQFFAGTDDVLLKPYRRTLLGTVTDVEPQHSGDPYFEVEYVASPESMPPLKAAVKEDQIVWARAPLRLDLAGGWSDTPPYTLRYGGQVVNVAVDLNGQPPIQVFCRRTTARKIVLHSIDLGVREEITDLAQLLAYRDPTSVFALPKAALCLLGLGANPGNRSTLASCLNEIGSGIELTFLCAVPKGSGLGTSSVLAAVILAALQRFFNRPSPMDDLFRQVLQMEQMLTTGGGWQDQIGGAVGGVKYIESKPGLKPSPVIHQLDPFLFQDEDMLRHFTLFYTGITRLAKNILQEVVANVNSKTPAYLFTVNYIRQLALNARNAVSLRSLPQLADVIAASWEANKRIHASTTNEEVEQLLGATRPYWAGVKLLGAGGGGFALFVSPGQEQAQRLRDLLARQFENRKARMVGFTLNPKGLQISVS